MTQEVAYNDTDALRNALFEWRQLLYARHHSHPRMDAVDLMGAHQVVLCDFLEAALHDT